ncbi:MAG: hypothetical protein ACHQO8_04670 [Vicinamibacterales bacterium]
MRHLLRLLLPLLVLAGPLAGQASAVTVKELLEYKAKLSDDVLIALIESDGSVFHLSIQDVAALRDQGLSERVILAMLKTATKRPEPASPASTAPQPSTAPVAVYAPPGAAVDQYGQPIAAPTEDQPKAPVVVNVKQEVTQTVEQPTQPNYSMSSPYGYAFSPYVYGFGAVAPARPVVAPPPAPVYWGWGGQRRPDSWQPSPPPPPPAPPHVNPTAAKTLTTMPVTKVGGG